MCRRVLSIWLSLAMVLGFVVIVDVLVNFTPNVEGTTLYVNMTGVEAYTKIQDAINDSKDGDTVFVYNGTYYENVIVNRTINLIGMNRDNTTIEGDGSTYTINVISPWVNITGFTISGGSEGIHLDSASNSSIFGNNISNNWHGIYLMNSNNTTIDNTNIFSNGNTGILLNGANNNTITDNRIYTNGQKGIDLFASHYNSLERNNISFHFGLDYIGIYLRSSNWNNITENDILNNDLGVWTENPSNNNRIFHNNFINNLAAQGADDGTDNKWNLTYPYGGNFWSDWTTPDTNGDGFVDNPKSISGGVSEDKWPYTTEDGWKRPVHNLDKNTWHYTIQEGVDQADPGNTIWVKNGTYYENVVVDKTVNLIGENRNTTTIDGGGSEDVVRITVDWVNITGFTFNNSGGDLGDAGLEVESDYNVILGNIASNNSYGLYFNSSSGNNITGNIVTLNNRVGIYIYSSSNNTITYNTVSSNNDKGIYLYYSSNSTITGNDVFSNNWEGIHLTYTSFNTVTNNDISMNEHGIYVYHSSYTTLNNNTCNSNDWDGIRLSSSTNNNITNNTVNLNARHGILLEDDSNNNFLFNNSLSRNGNGNGHYGIVLYGTQYNHILNNTIDFNKANVRGIHLGGAANNVIKYNHLTAPSAMSHGISLQGSNSKNNEIAFNEISNKSYGIYLVLSANNNVISNNIVSNNRYGISLWSSSNGNTISNNTANSNVYWGISLLRAPTNTVTDNTVNNNGRDGIYIGSSGGITVTRNNASNNNYYGIYIEASGSTTVSNNTMFNDCIFIYGSSLTHWNTHTIDPLNTVNGKPVRYWKNQNSGNVSQIFGQVILANCNNVLVENHNATGGSIAVLMGFSSNNTINNNTISENINYGMYLYQSSNNTIKNNTFSDNNFGIYMEESENNYVYHNNFENNPNQAFDNYINHWDNGYPLGGNYWSDYGGVDNYKGPNQDILGSDGIGDTNHPIPGGSNVDNYPLIGSYKPIENYTLLKQGWNLISIPFIQGNQDLIKVLEMIHGWYDAVQWYNNSDLKDQWKHHKVGKPYGNDLFELNETMGFWIHITQPGDTIFVYNGTQPTSNQTIFLHPGWNMVGYPSLTNHNRTVGLNNLTFGIDVDAVQWYDAATKTWHDMGPDDFFVSGRGYWVHANVECEWEVPL